MHAHISIKLPEEQTITFNTTEEATAWMMKHNEAPKMQKNFIRSHLESNGSVTRNFALSRFITRLGAIISDLKEEGMDIEGSYGENGVDFIYTLMDTHNGGDNEL